MPTSRPRSGTGRSGSTGSNPWDVLFKRLLEVRPADLLVPVLGPLPHGSFRFFRRHDKEMLRTRWAKPLDGVVEDLRGRRPLYHLEFEAVPQSDTGRRVFEHAAQLHMTLPTRPLQTLVYYLTPGRDGRRPVDHYHRYAGGKLQCAFDFHAVVLWEIAPPAFLDLVAPALWAMVPLCKAATVAHVRRAHRQIVTRVEKCATQIELDTVLYTLASTQFERATLAGIFKENMLMESWAIKRWMDEGERMGIAKGERMGIAKGERMGIAKGRAKGEHVGRIAGLQAACRSAIAAKLPRVSQSVERLLGRIENEKTLLRLVGELAAASDAKAVRAVLQQYQHA